MAQIRSILFLIPSLAARGAERVLVELVNSLDKSQYRVTVQTLFDVGELRGRLSPEVEYRAGFPILIRGYVQLMKLLSPQRLYRLIVGRRYDVVVAYLEGSVTRIVSGCPYPDTRKVAWVHIDQSDMTTLSYCFRSEAETRQCYARFDRVVAVSDVIRQHVEALLSRKCDLLYNVIDFGSVIQQSAASLSGFSFSSSYNLVSVGCLSSQKGFDRLIRVHLRLLEEGISTHVYLIGTGPQEKALKQLVRDLHLQDTVHFLGFKSNPFPYVAQADLYVCSSYSEGLSTSVVEAMVLGRPVVSTRCSGAEELLGSNNEYGLVVENTEQGIYDGIHQMLTTPGLLATYSSQSKISVTRFCKENTLRCYLDFFQSL